MTEFVNELNRIQHVREKWAEISGTIMINTITKWEAPSIVGTYEQCLFPSHVRIPFLTLKKVSAPCIDGENPTKSRNLIQGSGTRTNLSHIRVQKPPLMDSPH